MINPEIRMDALEEAPPVPIGKELVTVLTCNRGSATKRFTPSKVQGYQVGRYFDVDEHPINNIHDLHRLLTTLATDPKKMVIRGKPSGNQRRNVARRSRGEDATFTDQPIYWACVDVDGVGSLSPDATPRVEVQELLDSTPLLSGVSCVVQLSSSWGVKPGVRAHLWYWLEEPRTSRQVKEWVASLPFTVDESLYSAVQPHYTANPIFEGVKNPVPDNQRVFIIKGERQELYIPSGAADAEVSYWVEKIINVEGDARHPVINAAGYSLGGWVGAGVLGTDETVDLLVRACEDSGAFDAERLAAAQDEIKRAVADGSKCPREHEDWRAGMIRNKDGLIKPLPENYIRIFKQHQALKGVFGYDVRTLQTMLLKPPPWGADKRYPREMTDNDDTEASGWLNRIGVHTSAVGLISQAMTAAAHDNPFDRVVNWLNDLPVWDRTPRLYDWLPQVTGCPNTVYHRGAGAKFILGLIARAMDPGCKLDEMLVLVGPQGAYKSTLLAEVVRGPGNWAFSDCLGDIRRPQDYMPTLMGPWLIEVAELDSFSKKETEAVKKFLSTQSDRFRMSYGRRAVAIPRRGVLAGTSNTASFLTDLTGNRRFWPVDVVHIDLEMLKTQRDQIFAEALHQYKGGAIWYLSKEEADEAAEEQEKHRAYDPWEHLVRDYINSSPGMADLDSMIAGVREEVSVSEILTDVLRVPAGQISQFHSKRVSGILQRFGWKKVRVSKNDGTRPYVYVRTR